MTHPKNYSRNRLMTAGELANKFQTNIINFHEHHIGKALDRWGRWVIINGGDLADPEKLAYCKLDDNTMPAMSNGITVLQDGCATLLGKKPFTDWGAVLN